MSPQLIIALVLTVVGFTGGWTVQSWRYGVKEAKRAQQQLADERLAAKTAVRRIDNVVEAQSAAVVRERDLRAAAAGSRSALVSLHDAAASALRAASATHAACLDRAAAISVVLDQCGAAYQELGVVADRHASDVRTLVDAWPR